MKGTLILDRFFGIKVQIHWTFLFLIGWVIYLELRKGSDWPSILLTVFFGAQGENMMVHHISLLKGYKVSDAMMTHITAVSPHQTLKEVVDIMLAGTERHFVVAEGGEVKGIIYQNDLLQAIKEKGNEGRIEEAMNPEVISLSISDKLSTAYTLLLAKRNLYIPVLNHGVLTGAIDLENIQEFVLVQGAYHY